MPPFEYHPLYCEENVWRLCAHPRVSHLDKRVVFISNIHKTCAMWHMKTAAGRGAVIWDYHVILMVDGTSGWNAWDLDTDLGMPVDAARYLDLSFPKNAPNQLCISEDLLPRFRVVEADVFQNLFSSDRSHMAPSPEAEPANPPPWAPIFNGQSSNLFQFVDTQHDFVGEVTDLDGMRRLFC